jgi:glutamine amidotransferase
MNCNTPTDICFSFTGFQARGGVTDVHTDGWGIAFFEGKGIRQFLDSQPSANSPIAELVRNYPIKSQNVIAHIRKATQGVVALENTHPFQRALWGYYWAFAHNGNIDNFNPPLTEPWTPVGDTDSEKILCSLLQGLHLEFGETYPGAEHIFSTLLRLILPLENLGKLNFLLSNGDFLIAHCSTELSYLIRKAPFSVASLKDQDVTIDFSSLTTTQDRVAVIATQPLTENEPWISIEPGTLLLFRNGALILEAKTTSQHTDHNDL